MDRPVFDGASHPLSVHERHGTVLIHEPRAIDLHIHVNQEELSILLDKSMDPQSIGLIRHIIVVAKLIHVFDFQCNGGHAPKRIKPRHFNVTAQHSVRD